ncbi:MAG: SH3 domain-containing protein, partial [Chloroflexota bacterium]
ISILLLMLGVSLVQAQTDTTPSEPVPVEPVDLPDSIIVPYPEVAPLDPANVDDASAFPAPQYATDEIFALVSVNRANLRTAPNTTTSTVVGIAIFGDRFQIVDFFFPETSTVREPVPEGVDVDPDEEQPFVYDDPGEQEVWYLVEVNGGQAWIFGGLVLVANEDDFDFSLEEELTPEQLAFIDAQLAVNANSLGTIATVRMRSGPGTEFGQVTIVPYLARVVVVGRNEFSTWFYVDYNGTLGWVSVSLLAIPEGYNGQAVPVIR